MQPLARSDATAAAYASNVRDYLNATTAEDPLTIDALAAYLQALENAGTSYGGLRKRLYGIRSAFLAAGKPDPVRDRGLTLWLAGRARETTERRVRTITREGVDALLRATTFIHDPQRARALVLLAYAGAATRAEIHSLDIERIEEIPEGLLLTLTGYVRPARRIVLLRGSVADPVDALLTYIGDRTSGPVFIDGATGSRIRRQTLTEILWTLADRAGMPRRTISPLSLRDGFVFQVGRAGGTLSEAISQSGHARPGNARAVWKNGEAYGRHPQRLLDL
ncbi:MAG: tyrosine-type recombinase/integrase [Vulcanimicrobiaceae bacterium]